MRVALPEPIASPAPTAATLVATYPTRRGDRIILIRRPATMRRHPGQIAFPGGMIEPEDLDPFHCALREAAEEIALVVPTGTSPIPLTPVATLSSGIVIQPFWVRLTVSPRLDPEPAEVAEILRVPLAALSIPGALRLIPHPRRPREETPAYLWHEHIIWGATFQTLHELLTQRGLAITAPGHTS